MIILYRKGTSHICNGVTCEMQIVNEYGFESMLENGWYLRPEDCYPKPPKPKKGKENEKLSKSITNNGSNKLMERNST